MLSIGASGLFMAYWHHRKGARWCQTTLDVVHVILDKSRWSMRMNMNSERRGFVLVVVVLILSAVLGGVYGPSVRATSSSTDDYQTAVREFTRVLDVVQANYAETVDVDKAVYQGGIPGMLRVLDPHSNF